MDPNDRSLVGFTMMGHGIFHSYELAIPIFVIEWLEVFQVSPAFLGLLVGLGYGVIGLGALPSGILADRFNAKRLIILSIAGMGGGFLLLSVAPNVYLVGGGIVVWGLAASLYHPVGLSLISRAATQRGPVFAYHGVGGNIGTVLGPVIAASFLIFFDWRLVVVLLVVPSVAGVLLGTTIEVEERTREEAKPSATENPRSVVDGDAEASAKGRPPDQPLSATVRSLLADSRTLFTRGFGVVFVVVLVYGMYYRGLLTFLPEVLGALPQFHPVSILDRTVKPGQYVYSGLLTVGIFGQYIGGRVTDLVRAEYALLTTFLALTILSLLFLPAAAVGMLPFLVVCGLIGIALYAAAPIYQVSIAKHAATDIHGLSYGYTYLGMFGVGAIGATVAGSLLTYFDTAVLFFALAGISLFAVLLVSMLLVSERE